VNPPPPGGRDYVHKKIKDARGNLVSDKAANKPFLAYREWKVKEEEKERLKAEKVRRRAEKIAQGETLGPEDELEKEVSATVAIAQLLAFVIGSFLLAGWFITGHPLWGYDGKWIHLQTYIPSQFQKPQKLFSIEELATYDGTIPGKPIYLAIDGNIYDVTAGAHNYGVGGGYHNFVGIDASRAWATQCLKGHRTHDLRGLTAEELSSKDHWRKFFDNNVKYPHVGRVLLIPIDSHSPIPGPCGVDSPKAPLIGPQPPQPPQQDSGNVKKEL